MHRAPLELPFHTTYDVRDQMTAAWETPAGGSQTLLGSYEYDYQKRRVRRTVGGQPLDYIYNGINVVGEAAGGQLVARYDFGADLVRATFAGEPGSRWYGHDALGSTTALVGDDGALAVRYEYGAWGEIISAQQPSLNRVGFTGYRLDDETGLNYAINRYYDSSTGRFTSADPLTELDRGGRLKNPQGLNLYPYVAGNPTGRTDRDGRDWWYRGDPKNEYRLIWVERDFGYAPGIEGMDYARESTARSAGYKPVEPWQEFGELKSTGDIGLRILDYVYHEVVAVDPKRRNFREAFFKKDDPALNLDLKIVARGRARPGLTIEEMNIRFEKVYDELPDDDGTEGWSLVVDFLFADFYKKKGDAGSGIIEQGLGLLDGSAVVNPSTVGADDEVGLADTNVILQLLKGHTPMELGVPSTMRLVVSQSVINEVLDIAKDDVTRGELLAALDRLKVSEITVSSDNLAMAAREINSYYNWNGISPKADKAGNMLYDKQILIEAKATGLPLVTANTKDFEAPIVGKAGKLAAEAGVRLFRAEQLPVKKGEFSLSKLVRALIR